MKLSATQQRFIRRFHLWAAIVISLPIFIVITSGLFLQVKKEVAWIQPPSQKIQQPSAPSLSFAEILAIAQKIPEAEVTQWQDISKLDVRPNKGLIKIIAKNDWEVQINGVTGEILQVAYRRSDWIESLHDGSYFHDAAKLWFFLPVSILLFLMWLSGLFLFWKPLTRYCSTFYR